MGIHRQIHLIPGPKGRAGRRMIPQILPHPRQFLHQGDTQSLQLLGRPHPRQHQQMRRLQPPGAEDNLLAGHGENIAAAFHFHPYRPFALKNHPPRQYFGADSQIQAMAGRVQMGQGRRHSDALRVVHRHRRHPGGLRPVHIAILPETGGHAGLIQGGLNRRPLPLRPPQYRHRPLGAVKIVPDVQVALHFAEIGQYLEVSPFRVAPFGPAVIILGHPPQQQLPVNRPGTAHHLALGHVLGPLHPVNAAGQRPVMRRIPQFGVPGIPVLQVRRQGFQIRVIRPGFQQQHRPLRILGKAGGQHAPRGTGPNNNDIVLHNSLAERLPRIAPGNYKSGSVILAL